MKYRVKSAAISHNKVLYPEGSTIELEKHEAQQLQRFLEKLSSHESEAIDEDSKKPKNSGGK